MKKIYIIGPVGSGKTTLARQLSSILNIKMYELDTIVWDDSHGNMKRDAVLIEKLFFDIISTDSWILEDVGSKQFVDGIKNAEMVYYIDLGSMVIYKRCIMRWFRQKIGMESYHYKPTFKGLVQMLKWARKDIRNKSDKLKCIQDHAKQYRVIHSLNDIFGK